MSPGFHATEDISNPEMSKVSAVSMDEPVQEDRGPARHRGTSAGGHKVRQVLANGCMLLAGVGGGTLLAWWALSFHQSNEQLWMVPVGLVLAGTPVVAWLSIFASGICRSLQLQFAAAPPASSGPGEMIRGEGMQEFPIL
ncbi:hypothetical protein MUK42_29744 [Musa troglodytarum]|uniref:Uncharacterized protein n=1 Tax=Musa troglodytarum TaxID=320322 RepID=A0A9E7FU03_9LILI|nr:hypothetical protein MUK42_29744 [Musa troglodytarum]